MYSIAVYTYLGDTNVATYEGNEFCNVRNMIGTQKV